MATTFGWLPEQAAEDALHAERLLFVEERPFQRVRARLLADDSKLRDLPRQLPSPPPEGEEIVTDPQHSAPFSRDKFWEDVLIDFAALESSVTRIQLIHQSNERERDRYASEKTKILATAQAVKDNTLVLRAQLEEAQTILKLRKGYDDLASKILDDKKLKSRDNARQDISTLEKDIEALQAEGQDIEGLWDMRKEAFDKYVEDGKAFTRTIKGIKDQPDDEDKEDDEMSGEQLAKSSNVGTPLPESVATPRPDLGGLTPMPSNDDDMDDIVPEEQRTHSRLREAENAEDVGETTEDQEAIDAIANENGAELSQTNDVDDSEMIQGPLIDNVDDDNTVETMEEA